MYKATHRITRRTLLVTASLLALAGLVSLFGCGPGPDDGRGTSRQFSSLAIALTAYEQQFGALPPSDPARVGQCGDGSNKVGPGFAATGAEALCFFLRGWYMNGPRVVCGVKYRWTDRSEDVIRDVPPMYTPDEDEEFVAADARYGFGGAPKGRFFGDAFRTHRPILYFRATATTEGANPFVEAHNSLIINKWKAPNAMPFDRLVLIGGVPRATQFLLWSAGQDGLYLSNDDILIGR